MKNFKVIAVLFFIGISISASAQRTKITNEAKTNSASTTTEKGKDVSIEGMGITKTVAMNGENLRVQGADCNITVTGSVNNIWVEGANVTIKADRVNSVKIEGANTHVFYKTSGNKYGKATADVFGTNSGVIKK